jgi:peptidyl-prolyl cis-trans isomerase C
MLLVPLAGSLSAHAVVRRLATLVAPLVKNRLLQFALLGGALFALAPPPASRAIELSSQAISSMTAAQARRLGVATLAPEQAREVAMRALEDEVLYREALRLGLDNGDPVVRQHLINKVLFLAEDLAGSARPSGEAELQAHYQAHLERWRRPAAARFVHVFASSEHRDALAALAPRLDERRGGERDSAPPLGEAFPLSRDVPLTSLRALAQTYGDSFAMALPSLHVGEWSAPVESRFGWHLVRVLERVDEQTPQLEEVRDQVKLDLQEERKRRGVAQFVARAQSRYRIELAGRPITELDPVALPLPAVVDAGEE